jgi:DNA polymerase-3 subunit alpha
MAEERDRFVSGAVQQGYTQQMGAEIFNLIEPFAGYAFNKAHSVSYGLISYWTAYFKTHYPLEYMASVLNCRLDHGDRYVASINECTRMGIGIELPDVNQSGIHYTIDCSADRAQSGKLRIGLAAIKTVGEAAITPIVTERVAKGPYASITDFCRRVDVSGLNRRTLEGLAKAGAFDSFAPRATVIGNLDRIWALAQQETRNRNSGQFGMFGDEMDSGAGGTLLELDTSQPDYTPQEKANLEKEYLGVALSYNPLLVLAAITPGDAYNSIDQLDEGMISSTVTLLGHVAAVTERYTKDNRKFLRVDLAMVGGQVEAMVWPDSLEKTAHVWQTGRVARVTGRLQIRGDDFSISCYDAQEYQLPDNAPMTSAGEAVTASASKPAPVSPSAPARPTRSNGNRPAASQEAPASSNGHRDSGVLIRMVETDQPDEDRYRLRQAIRVMLEYTGDDKVYLELHLKEGRTVLMEIPTVSTAVCDELQQRVQDLLLQDETCTEYPAKAA